MEDAVFTDLDGDGAWDVVSSCEGKVQSLFVHWAPREKARYLEADAWQTEAIPAARRSMQWMFCLPLQVDGKNGVDLVAGGKNIGAQVGWFEAPVNPRHLADWKWHPWRAAGWIMSLAASDMDEDGDCDVVVSDRKGPKSGCFWLENPGPGVPLTAVWREHTIGGAGREVMFLTLADLDRDGWEDVVVAVQPQELLLFRRRDRSGLSWETHSIKLPESAGWSKAVSVGDINLDGKQDIAFTCERAVDKSGVMSLSCRKSTWEDEWEGHEISGRDGVKHDLLRLIDLDGDGDLDALTCEETKNLGVFWYENPAKAQRDSQVNQPPSPELGRARACAVLPQLAISCLIKSNR